MILGLIPARLDSKRLPEKPLALLDGMPLIIHVYERAKLSLSCDEIIVCTDSDKILNEVKRHGGKAVMTSKKHKNGTERISEVAKNFKPKLVLDIQGDEPLLNPNDIDVVVNYHLDNSNFEIIVPSHPTNEKIENPNIVKIVSNDKGEVVYFSRSLIPNNFKAKKVFFHRHLSIVSFKPETLQKFANLEPSNLEKIEDVELLRALENKIRIGTLSIKGNSFSVDTKDDLAKAKKIIKDDPIRKLY